MQEKFPITTTLVKSLIKEQFPEWSNVPIMPVAQSGWDNRTFHLGDDKLIRLPSAEGYAAQVKKEQEWLPKLAPHLSCLIPIPIAMGKPSSHYPWHWSVYGWLEGESANVLSNDVLDMPKIAEQMAGFLKSLHALDTQNAPPPGLHNYWRGGDLKVYDDDTLKALDVLGGIVDRKAVLSVWNRALLSSWKTPPVWVHGDVSSGNFLIKNGVLSAVIDFGCMAVGDPACDLVIAWAFFDDNSRALFKKSMGMDTDTWARARGWALWKALFELAACEDKNSADALKHLYIIEEVIKEHSNDD